MTLILAGDVGGTKSNLGLFEVVDGEPQLTRSAQYPSPLMKKLSTWPEAVPTSACAIDTGGNGIDRTSV